MKNILVPTDFSNNAENAIVYAVELAKVTGSNLILFHAYHVVQVPAVPLSSEEMDQMHVDKLKKIIEKRFPSGVNGVQTEFISRLGFLMDAINTLVEEKNIDLIIMGRSGAGTETDHSMGRNTIKVMEMVETPVLAIPENARFKIPRQIVYASDFISITDGTIPEIVKELTSTFNAHLSLVHVIPVDEPVTEEIVKSSDNVKQYLMDSQYSVNFPVNEDVVEGIHEFSRNISADIIVMMPRRHNFLERIFISSHTEKIAYESSVPILAVRGNED